ncbi:MAG: DUF1116 domain-containing protein, partial [Candidatus Limnocylindrales bacterium]
MSAAPATTSTFFADGIRAVTIGPEMFATPLVAAGIPVVALDWRPPAEGDRNIGLLLSRLEDDPSDPVGQMIASANATAIERLLAAQPMLVDVAPAGEALGLGKHQLLHSGPPIGWERMAGPVQG